MAETRKNLGDILIDEGVLSREELDEVLEKSKTRSLSLEDTLFKLGYISRDRLSGLLAEAHDCEFVDLYSSKVDGAAIGMIPPDQALELKALPYAIEEDTLSVAVTSDTLENLPLDDMVRRLEELSGKKISIRLCNPGPLNEMLMRHCRAKPKDVRLASASRGELASIIHSLKSDQAEGTLRSRFEELYDVGQTALIGARSHPFSRAVADAIEDARAKLTESKKYVDSGFEEEAIEMAKQAVSLLRDATARADAFEKDWEKLLQDVKKLRAKIAALEGEGAAEYAAAEFKELAEIREGLLECVNKRDVGRLRALLDQGMVVTEKVSLIEPGRGKGREQVIAGLTQVREVIARARNAGAKEHAPDALKDAHEHLDRAEAYARHAQWEEVRECLASAESKALEAERIAAGAEKEKGRLTTELRESIRAAMAVFEEALTRPFANEVIDDLMRAKDVINETKACFESDELERGIGLARNVTKRIKEEIIPLADEADLLWSDLFARSDAVSARIQSVDIPLALKITPEKMRLLFQSEREMVASLCERDRNKLAEAVTICEGLAGEVEQVLGGARGNLQRCGNLIDEVNALLASTAAAGIDGGVAGAYDEARRMLEEARGLFEQGDAEAAIIRAQAAKAKLESEVIEPQDSARREWSEISQRASEASKQLHSLNMPLGHSIVPEKMEQLFRSEREMVASLCEGDGGRLAEAVSTCERLATEIRDHLTAAQDGLQQAVGVIEEVTSLFASVSATGIEEEVAAAYDGARRLLEEARSLFDGGNADIALSRAQAARVKLETEVIEPRDSAQREWNELSRKAIEVSEQIQSMNMPVVLKVAAEKMEHLFEKEREMIVSLSERDRGRLSEAVSICERLAEEIRQAIVGVRETIRQAEGTVLETARFLADAAASGIDEKVAAAYDESMRILDEGRALLDEGDAEAALDRARTARVKLETEVVEFQESSRQAWLELSRRVSEVFEDMQAIDMPLSVRVAPDKIRLLLDAERDMAIHLCERDRDGLAGAVGRCEGLSAEILQILEATREGLMQAEQRATQLQKRADEVASAEAIRYCSELVDTLRANTVRMVSARTSNDIEGLMRSIEAVEQNIQSIEVAVDDAKVERHGDLWEQLGMIEDAVQDAVRRCAGNYSPDMLEDAYLDLNRIKENLSGGPEALSAETEIQLARELAVARTKVWQVEFMRERIERERGETLGNLRLMLAATKEAVDACAGLDFIDDFTSLLEEARDCLAQVDNLTLEGDVETSFEQIRRADALADRIRAEVGEKESLWRELAGRLTAEDARHKAFFSDPATQKAAGQELRDLSELDTQTQGIIDMKNLAALEEHARKLAGLADAVSDRVEAWKRERRAEIGEKLEDARRELRLAEIMNAANTCPDVFDAATTYIDIVATYLANDDFDAAQPAAEDALAKSREAGSLAKAGWLRESSLALDYMKIAAAQIAQGNFDGARDALQRGLNLARSVTDEQASDPQEHTESDGS